MRNWRDQAPVSARKRLLRCAQIVTTEAVPGGQAAVTAREGQRPDRRSLRLLPTLLKTTSFTRSRRDQAAVGANDR